MDTARVIATAAVVLIHVVAPVVSGGRDEALTHPRWWVGNMMDSSARFAVPLFVMMSGALLLSSRRTSSVREFYTRRLHRVALPLAFWSLAYIAFRVHVLDQEVSTSAAIRSIVAGSPYFHLYFLFIILGLYALTPFLRLMIQTDPERVTRTLAFLLLGLGAVDQMCSAFFGLGGSNAVTKFVPYLGYFVAGYALTHVPTHPRLTRIAAVAFTGSTLVTAIGTWALAREYGWGARAGYLYGYLSPTVIVASLAAYVLLRALVENSPLLRRPPVERSIAGASAVTFGIYLVHAMFIPLAHMLAPLPSRAPALLVAVATQWVVITAASLAAVLLLRQIPFLRRLV